MTDEFQAAPASHAPLAHDRKHPFLAEITEHRMLTRPGSAKDTRHFVFNLAGSGLSYTPGDSLGVFGRNPPFLVEEILRLLGRSGEEHVLGRDGQTTPFRWALERDYILNRAGKKILATLASKIGPGPIRARLETLLIDPAAQASYLFTRDYVDLLQEFSEATFDSPGEFLAQLSPLPPRLYSIASSLAAHPGEVHLCVGIVRYHTHGRDRQGLCTGFLADHTELRRKEIPVYVQVTKSFRLPDDPRRDIIMVGPGTGIAPFRAFVEQRALDGAPGRNWLFFGEQHRATDFLYEEDWETFRRRGVLHRVDLAFSRDRPSKIYVQDRMRESGRALWDWLQNGAYFYVCGDARRMAKDVHQALIGIARDHGGLKEPDAVAYVEQHLAREEKRYLKDVY